MLALDLVTLIMNAALGTFSTNLYVGAAGSNESDGPFTVIREVGGMADLETQNGVTNERPSCQVVVTAKHYLVAASLLLRLRALIRVVTNVNVGAYTVSISGIVRAAQVATATTPTLHRFYEGQTVTISGAGQAAYNGEVVITSVPTSKSFTFAVVGSPATPATGTIEAAYAGTWYQLIRPQQSIIDLGPDTSSRVRLAFNVRAVKRPS